MDLFYRTNLVMPTITYVILFQKTKKPASSG